LEHLLNSCPFANQKWSQVEDLFGRMDRDQHNIKQTILHWDIGLFSSSVLNRAWGLTLGFTRKAIWKERNSRIFKDKFHPQAIIWEGIICNTRETILAEKWNLEDW